MMVLKMIDWRGGVLRNLMFESSHSEQVTRLAPSLWLYRHSCKYCNYAKSEAAASAACLKAEQSVADRDHSIKRAGKAFGEYGIRNIKAAGQAAMIDDDTPRLPGAEAAPQAWLRVTSIGAPRVHFGHCQTLIGFARRRIRQIQNDTAVDEINLDPIKHLQTVHAQQ